MRFESRWIAGLALLMLASTAAANGGTPLLWLGCCWLFLGNWAIGRFECWVIRRVSGIFIYPPYIVLGNYVSAAGGVGLVMVLQRSDLVLGGYIAFVGAWVASFVLSLVIEAVFVWLAMRQVDQRVVPWRAFVVANVASYALIVPLSLVAGATSLWQLRVVAPGEIHTIAGRAIFVGEDGRTVWSVRLDGTGLKRIYRLQSNELDVYVCPTADGKRTQLLTDQGDFLLALGGGLQAPATVFRGDAPVASTMYGRFNARSYVVPQPETARIRNGFWGVLGLRVNVAGVERNYALETPFVAGLWKDAILLPDDKLVARLNNLIVLVDPKANTVAVLGRGRSPSTLLDPGVAPPRSSHRLDSERDFFAPRATE